MRVQQAHKRYRPVVYPKMLSDVPGNGVTGSDYEQVRVTSSMPAKKRLVEEYRELAPRDSDAQSPSSVAATGHFKDPPRTGQNLYDTDLQGGDRDVYCDNGGSQYDCVGAFDLRANKNRVLGMIANVLASGDSNEEKERKLGDIIADLETLRRRLSEQRAAALKVFHR